MPRVRLLDAIDERYKKDLKALKANGQGNQTPPIKNYPAPTIRRVDAERCTRFMHDLAWTTTAAVAAHFHCVGITWPADMLTFDR